jgi:hypothetical protein
MRMFHSFCAMRVLLWWMNLGVVACIRGYDQKIRGNVVSEHHHK